MLHSAKSLQSCPTLCDPRDGSPPGSPVPGILQAICCCIANESHCKRLPLHIANRSLQMGSDIDRKPLLCYRTKANVSIRNARNWTANVRPWRQINIVIERNVCVLSRFSHVQLCGMPSPGSSVHEILQARILEWDAMPSSRGSSQPREWTGISYLSCIGRRILYH